MGNIKSERERERGREAFWKKKKKKKKKFMNDLLAIILGERNDGDKIGWNVSSNV